MGVVPRLVEIAQAPIVTYDTRSSVEESLASVNDMRSVGLQHEQIERLRSALLDE